MRAQDRFRDDGLVFLESCFNCVSGTLYVVIA